MKDWQLPLTDSRFYSSLVALLDLDVSLWSDLGPSLSCCEAETFCAFLKASNQEEKARVLYDSHCCSDSGEENDNPKHLERKRLLESLPEHDYRNTPALP